MAVTWLGDAAVVPTVLPLVGVLIGGALTYAVTTKTQRRQWHLDQRAGPYHAFLESSLRLLTTTLLVVRRPSTPPRIEGLDEALHEFGRWDLRIQVIGSEPVNLAAKPFRELASYITFWSVAHSASSVDYPPEQIPIPAWLKEVMSEADEDWDWETVTVAAASRVQGLKDAIQKEFGTKQW